MQALDPTTKAHAERLADLVQTKAKVRPVGAGTKAALSGWGNVTLDDVTGVLEYNPQEYTFTALAGTPLKEISELLAKEGQYLPFDPPFVAAGATLGGTVAAGLSGAGRFRYGGVRDFLLGLRFVDGTGRLVTGGGKVVKNAAGFDFPKLLVGSRGQLGIMVEMTFKVFPQPETYATFDVTLPSFNEAVDTLTRLAMSGLELSCLDLTPAGRLLVRVGGAAAATSTRLERLQHFIKQEGEVLAASEDISLWRDAAEFSWLAEGVSLVKVPLNPANIKGLEEALLALADNLPRRYSVGGNLLWLGYPVSLDIAPLDSLLKAHGLSGLVLTGSSKAPVLGQRTGSVFFERLQGVLDPDAKFSSSGAVRAT